MPLATTMSVALLGVDGYLVEVEADLAAGLPGMTLIGLPDAALHEARDRIRAAVVNSGRSWPSRRITVGLSPAWRPKRGSGFDLAIAAAVLTAAGDIPPGALNGTVLLGELGLDGRVRSLAGTLPAVLAAAAAGVRHVIVPVGNAGEAALVPGVEVRPVESLSALLAAVTGPGTGRTDPGSDSRAARDGARVVGGAAAGGGRQAAASNGTGGGAPGAAAGGDVQAVSSNGTGGGALGGGSGPGTGTLAVGEGPSAAPDAAGLPPGCRAAAVERPGPPPDAAGLPPAVEHASPSGVSTAVATVGAGDARAALPGPDLADVVGQFEARWALEIAAAGGHHLYLKGPPGVGKTMLAERLPGLLPELDVRAALEVTAVHSVAGALRPDQPLITRPPFAAPHHTATVPALIGGGSGLARPGAVSMAHRGVLFLDEAPEFAAGCLDALRQPLESGEVYLSRSGGTVRYPARFTLVLAANPCPCGQASDACDCGPDSRRRYANRLSRPLLDRIDLVVVLAPPDRHELLALSPYVETSETVAGRVLRARQLAREVFAGHPWSLPSEIPARELRGHFAPGKGGTAVLDGVMRRGMLSPRGLDRTLRVSWTVAFCAGLHRPGPDEVRTAVGLRLGDMS